MPQSISPQRLTILQRIGLLAILLGVLTLVAFFVAQSLKSAPPEITVPEQPQEEVASPLESTVTLTSDQIHSITFSEAPVQRVAMQPSTVVPGRLEYNEERHVAVKAPIDGVVVELKRIPGEMVSKGDVLAVVSGPALAQARASARSSLADRQLAEVKRRVQTDVLGGVKTMIEMMDRDAAPKDIEEAVGDQTMGDYREKLITAYTRSRLAKQMAEGSRTAASTGAIPQRTQQQRESEWQAADANLQAVKEQVLVEATRMAKEADAGLDGARRQVEVKMNELRTLLGPAAKPISEGEIEKESADVFADVTLVSPMAGTVEERLVATSERVSAGDTIYVVADTSQLWAVAQLRQRDWQAISIQPGTPVTIQSPALKDQTYKAEVKIVGRKVDPVTGSTPITACLSSPNDLLRPGLFIYVELPTGPSRNEIAIPTRSIVAHDNQNYVFVKLDQPAATKSPTSDNDFVAEASQTFRVQPVVVGQTLHDLTEIKAGLNEGETVVVEGAFTLKSKWLLASEGEE